MRRSVARASELEQGFPFGVARQLIESPGDGRPLELDVPDRDPADLHAVIYDLYWATAERPARRRRSARAACSGWEPASRRSSRRGSGRAGPASGPDAHPTATPG